MSGGTHGEEVHAGSFLRKREIVLDTALLESPGELARILLHELFHFVWLRAGNPARRSYEALLGDELRRVARGELGWSAAKCKRALAARDVGLRTRRWREYACESFCDSAAWLLSGLREHDEYTLAPRFRQARRRWLRSFLARPRIPV
jgi:hypothetical protein